MRRSIAVNALPDYPLKRSRSSQLLLLLSSDVLQLWAQWWIMPRCMKTTSLIAVNQMSCLVVRRAKKIFPRWNVFFSLDDPVLCLTRTLILWPLASRQLCLVCPLNLSVCIGRLSAQCRISLRAQNRHIILWLQLKLHLTIHQLLSDPTSHQ